VQHLIPLCIAISLSLVSAASAATIASLPFKGPAQIEELRDQGIEIVAFTKYGVDVRADDKQMSFLRSRNYPVSVLYDSGMARVAGPGPTLGLYHTYAEMETTLNDLATTYPALTQLSVIGTSIEGRNIYSLKVSDNVTVDESEPEVLFMGNHHARELMSVEMPLRFAMYLLENYAGDATVQGYVNDREIWFVPMVNPDGHVFVENNNAGYWGDWWRKNRRVNADFTIGVDLNRNYGLTWGYDDVGSSPIPGNILYRGTAAFSEPETATIRAFVNSRQFTMWLSYHSYGELLLYPWGYAPLLTPDHDVYVELGKRLTETNGYLAGNVVTGAIYLANGDTDDWGYGEQGEHSKIFAFTPELNSFAQGGFGPPDTLIAPTFALNLEMNMRVLEYAANPYQVVGPYAPAQYAITEPWGNSVHRLSWSAPDPGDPNPATAYDIESCRDPGWTTDAGGAPWWNLDGFAITGSGHTGAGYFSGAGDNLFNTMTMTRPFVVDPTHQTLTFWINYDIETDWDYGYVDVSADGGLIWESVAGNVTTTFNPNGNNRGNGITGSSGGWVQASFPLGAWMGQSLLVRISYITDGFVINPGMYVDTIDPVPTCAAVEMAASGVIGTAHDIYPTTAAMFRYRVRGIDGEGDMSRWSNTEDYVATTVTRADNPVAYETSLGRNYPNPFNPTTTIPFIVGGAGVATRGVTVAIYDARGAQIATLVEGRRPPGAHEAVWDGRSDRGRPVPSGIYFVRLVVEGSSAATRKLVLLK